EAVKRSAMEDSANPTWIRVHRIIEIECQDIAIPGEDYNFISRETHPAYRPTSEPPFKIEVRDINVVERVPRVGEVINTLHGRAVVKTCFGRLKARGHVRIFSQGNR